MNFAEPKGVGAVFTVEAVDLQPPQHPSPGVNKLIVEIKGSAGNAPAAGVGALNLHLKCRDNGELPLKNDGFLLRKRSFVVQLAAGHADCCGAVGQCSRHDAGGATVGKSGGLAGHLRALCNEKKHDASLLHLPAQSRDTPCLQLI